jgi:hypothetical protein
MPAVVAGGVLGREGVGELQRARILAAIAELAERPEVQAQGEEGVGSRKDASELEGPSPELVG